MPDEPKAKGIDEPLDDWIAAIDEWASGLSLPTDGAADKTPQPEPLPPTRPAAKAKTEEPARSAERERERERESESSGERDPLAELVGGDFELAEEAGEALGPLLSQERPAAPSATEAAGRVEEEVASVLETGRPLSDLRSAALECPRTTLKGLACLAQATDDWVAALLTKAEKLNVCLEPQASSVLLTAETRWQVRGGLLGKAIDRVIARRARVKALTAALEQLKAQAEQHRTKQA